MVKSSSKFTSAKGRKSVSVLSVSKYLPDSQSLLLRVTVPSRSRVTIAVLPVPSLLEHLPVELVWLLAVLLLVDLGFVVVLVVVALALVLVEQKNHSLLLVFVSKLVWPLQHHKF